MSKGRRHGSRKVGNKFFKYMKVFVYDQWCQMHPSLKATILEDSFNSNNKNRKQVSCFSKFMIFEGHIVV